MFSCIYQFLWTLAYLFFVAMAVLFKNRRLYERLALNLPSTCLGENSIWVHALSVGEVISAVALVKTLLLKYPDRPIVFSVTTAKGMEVARDELEGKVKALITMPVDTWFCIHRIVRFINPQVFVLVETDIWPGLLGFLKKRGVKAILVNGRVSPRTFKLYRKAPFISRRLFEPFVFCLMQSDIDSKRLLEIGVNPFEKVITTGNIKFDRDWNPLEREERTRLLESLSLGSEETIWVAGSTHPGEEEIIFRVFKRLKKNWSPLRLIIAPRQIEQSEGILKMISSMGLNGLLKTDCLSHTGYYDILILDTIGELGRIYGLGKISFVGGSLVPFGGHNLLEPASFGCPVLFGPYTHNFVLMSEQLTETGGGLRVDGEEGLFMAMDSLLRNDLARNNMGRLAREFVENNRGALKRVESFIDICLERGH
ncbi:putative 3-deoxy-D-manno-octulosonic-acid transferase [uncultured Desulfobacterium sp.]|uniref:3-deoxy-D-manno-octulosonic acid transferase n=1 Tax=uncultured Desulfobacterium sp. TaxID=201089 RepID=A0A445N481_9BACT|nr:putative 3-deoxy-D-manno-octulosonic-acid transferase [uncultured Desulfobacterium sp.]